MTIPLETRSKNIDTSIENFHTQNAFPKNIRILGAGSCISIGPIYKKNITTKQFYKNPKIVSNAGDLQAEEGETPPKIFSTNIPFLSRNIMRIYSTF